MSSLVRQAQSNRESRRCTLTSFFQWTTGSQIVYREIWQGKVWTARPVIVVQDRPDLMALYLPLGTRWRLPAGDRKQYFHYLQTGEWTLADVVWLPGDTLFLLHPGEAHAVHVMWGAKNREFVGWYINLQEPARRTSIGLDFMDQELDIYVKPDLSEWVWKDEEHLQRAQTDGRFSAEQVDAIRTEGERMITRVQDGASPFNDGWETWNPPAEWSTPHLEEGWDRIERDNSS
jgi:predicted RNA-binding protein associated with RNAse of E/G family